MQKKVPEGLAVHGAFQCSEAPVPPKGEASSKSKESKATSFASRPAWTDSVSPAGEGEGEGRAGGHESPGKPPSNTIDPLTQLKKLGLEMRGLARQDGSPGLAAVRARWVLGAPVPSTGGVLDVSLEALGFQMPVNNVFLNSQW